MILALPLTLACAACSAPDSTPAEPISAGCSIIDGGTIRFGAERICLLGIDAPEVPGHCREGRTCAPGDPVAATAALSDAMAGRAISVQRFGQDRYSHTLAIVRAEGVNTSCSQIASGHAIYVARWDKAGGIVARECGFPR